MQSYLHLKLSAVFVLELNHQQYDAFLNYFLCFQDMNGIFNRVTDNDNTLNYLQDDWQQSSLLVQDFGHQLY